MLKKNKIGESFVGIIVGIIILTIVVLGVGKLISHSKTLLITYGESRDLRILRNNLSNIIKQIDTTGIIENEVFYIYKDTSINEFLLFTGATNDSYKYIDRNGDYIVNIDTFNGNIYSRILFLEREDTSMGDQNQVIKASIKKLIKK